MQRISRIIEDFPEDIFNKIENLISNNDSILSLNDVRYDQCDFSYTEIVEEIIKVKSLASIYQFCKKQIPILGLSQNAVRYYSSNMEQYPIARLRKLNKLQRILYTICYIYCRYQVFIDNLIASFMHYTILFRDKSKDYAEKAFAAHIAKIIKTTLRYQSFSDGLLVMKKNVLLKSNTIKKHMKLLRKRILKNLQNFLKSLTLI